MFMLLYSKRKVMQCNAKKWITMSLCSKKHHKSIICDFFFYLNVQCVPHTKLSYDLKYMHGNINCTCAWVTSTTFMILLSCCLSFLELIHHSLTLHARTIILVKFSFCAPKLYRFEKTHSNYYLGINWTFMHLNCI